MIGQEIAVAFKELELMKSCDRLPPHLVEDQVFRLAVKCGHAQKNQLDWFLAGVGVLVALDLRVRCGTNREFLFQLPDQRLGRRLAGFDLAAWKLPLERIRLFGCTLSHKDLTL